MLTAFGTIFVAELPDKTMLATIVLSARYRRPLVVWIGAATALVAQMVIAVAAGRLLDLSSPTGPSVSGWVATLFGVGAVLLWRSAAAIPTTSSPSWKASSVIGQRSRSRGGGCRHRWRIVFLAEWGDLTQLATASLAAKGEPLSVFVGGSVADGQRRCHRGRCRSGPAARRARAGPATRRRGRLRRARRRRRRRGALTVRFRAMRVFGAGRPRTKHSDAAKHSDGPHRAAFDME